MREKNGSGEACNPDLGSLLFNDELYLWLENYKSGQIRPSSDEAMELRRKLASAISDKTAEMIANGLDEKLAIGTMPMIRNDAIYAPRELILEMLDARSFVDEIDIAHSPGFKKV